MDFKDIKAIVDLMKKNSISEFELEKDEFKIRLKRGLNGGGAVYDEPVLLPASLSAPAMSGAAQSSAPAGGQASAASGGGAEIKAPMIGTFYRSPSPDSPSYVDVGTEVGPDTTVCIIEAMKVMNEIKAEVAGVVTQVLTENGKPVEFGQPLFRVRPL